MKIIRKPKEKIRKAEPGDYVVFSNDQTAIIVDGDMYTIVYLEDGFMSKDYESDTMSDLIDKIKQDDYDVEIILKENIEIKEI